MFCKYCESLNLDAAASFRGAPHHESFADLVASADNGCELCTWIIDHARLQENLHSSKRVTCHYNDEASSLFWLVGEEGLAYSYICAAKDDPVSKIVHCRPVCSDISSERFYGQIRRWMNACSSKHRSCQPRVRSRLPTRVIDVGEFGDSVSLFTSNGQYGQWVALSYCWGNKVPLRTLSSNLESFQRGILLELLPPLFRDAVKFVRRLGHRYLWIDALCIIQDSEMDWMTESAKMGEIFQNAALSILPESVGDSSVGLFSNMNQNRQVPSIVIQAHSQRHGIQGHLCAGIDTTSSVGPLSRRAWTFQEELLSPCVIRFAESQVWWQCRKAFRCETYPDELRERPYRQEWSVRPSANFNSNLNKVLFKSHHRIYRGRKSTYIKDIFPAIFSKLDNILFKQHHRAALLRSWYKIVKTYCGRESTYVKDTFPAISGIARQYRRHGLQDYKAGLWLEDIHLGLLWTTSITGRKTKTPYVAPSWSWASMELGSSGIEYNRFLLSDIAASPLVRVARIESVNAALLSDDPFGQITAANLVITGPSIRLCRNDIPGGFMDISSDISEDRNLYEYWLSTYPRDELELKLHWSLRKTATCNIWTVESVTWKSFKHLQHPCLLLHVASHQGNDTTFMGVGRHRCAFCLILELVPDEDDEETSEQNELTDTDDQSDQSKAEKARERDCQMQLLDSKTRKKPAQYRRIGLAILQEIVPTSTIWFEETVMII